MTPDHLLRTSLWLCEGLPGQLFTMAGDDAWDVVDQLIAGPLRVRDGRVQPALWLDPDGRPLADLVILRDRDEFTLSVDARLGFEPAPALLAMAAPSGARLRPRDELVRVGIHGPFAWEAATAVFGPAVVGVPFQTALELPDGEWLVRTSTTGEFGYELWARPASAARYVLGLRDAAVVLGIWDRDQGVTSAKVASAVLDRAALENGHFCVRHGGVSDLTAAELQLLHRVDPAKRTVRAPDRLVVWITGDADATPGSELLIGGSERVGRVLHRDRSPVLGEVLGLALVDASIAWPGVVLTTPEGHRVETASPPFIDNRSLSVEPQRHRAANTPEWGPWRR
ncbi:MAG: aminomethyl transferase family protein [Myxococcales bacterium]|nr:aminomethyl transferase family protein [Myxococcales bacterium]